MSRVKKGRFCGDKNSSYGTHWIHNDDLNLKIKVPDALYWDYIASGWINGRGAFATESMRQKCRDNTHRADYRYINNGEIEKQIPLASVVPTGFYLGRIKKSKSRLKSQE